LYDLLRDFRPPRRQPHPTPGINACTNSILVPRKLCEKKLREPTLSELLSDNRQCGDAADLQAHSARPSPLWIYPASMNRLDMRPRGEGLQLLRDVVIRESRFTGRWRSLLSA
jgi:hypothetical protein